MEIEIPKKRGRGRPRKIAAPPPEVIAEEPEEIPPPAAEIIPLAYCPPEHAEEDEEERVALAPIPHDDEPGPPPFAFEPPKPAPVLEPMDYQAHVPMAVFTPRPEPPDDREERRQIIDKIKKYRQGFDAARALPFDESMSTDRLRSLLDDIRLSISSRNTSLIFRSGYLTAVKGVEIVGSKAGMRCYGLADTLGKSVEVSDLLKEIEAEVGIKYISPWKRLAFITVSTAVVLDGMNRRAETLASFKSEPVSPVLDDRYKDL